MDYAKQLKTVDYAQRKLEIKRMSIIEKAAKSDNPEDIIAASNAVSKIQKANFTPAKAFFIDPLDFNANLGYKDKAYSLTYTTLKRMAGTPIINAIIKTRKNQIADFAEPQADRYSTGFVIRKKAKNGVDSRMDNKDKKVANAISDFILNCGSETSWVNDDFDTFIRKIVDDSLTYDQMTFECIRNRRGKLERFIAVDASTFRMADTAFQEDYKNTFFNNRGASNWNSQGDLIRKEVNGYLPQYVQIYQNAVVNDFYPWELCFAVRNPSTSIYSNGYGVSELEELINVITSMLWGDEYNRRFFSQGSAPKGLLRVKGGMSESALQQFKQQWQAMINGVVNSWKTPVVEADVDWIDLQKNNRDMEYSSWMEYLIKLACAIYSIDPSEIGWDISRSGGNSGLFEKSEAERIQNSKDKGLYPMLKFIQRKINKYIVEQINPEFEFVFMGMNGMTIEQELEMDIKKLNSFQTLNETREKWDLPAIKETGDIIENSVYWQAESAKQQREQQEQQQQMQMQMGGGYGDEGEGGQGWGGYGDDEEGGEEDYNPFDEYAEEGEGEEESNESEDDDEGETDEDTEKSETNAFVKAFEDFLAKEEQEIND
nr:MAG TPA: Portal protein [Caudoviricetes sp.]